MESKILKITDIKDLSEAQKEYIKFCKNLPSNFFSNNKLEKGKYFYHEELGINIVDRRTNDKILIPNSCDKIKREECVFLPSIENVKEYMEEHGFSHLLDIFEKEVEEDKYLRKFRLFEERWIACYLRIFKYFYDFDTQQWFERENRFPPDDLIK